MLLVDKEIRELIDEGFLSGGQPVVNTASVDVTWSGVFRCSKNMVPYLDLFPGETIRALPTWEKEAIENSWGDCLTSEYLVLNPERLYLIDTAEKFRTPHVVGALFFLKSTLARAGLEHLHAGFFDPGFGLKKPSTGTLEVFNKRKFPIVIKKGQRLGQMIIFSCNPPKQGYDEIGSYNGQLKPGIVIKE